MLAGIRSLVGTRRRLAVVTVLLLVVAGGGAVALGVLGTPSVTGVENRFAGVNETTTVIETDLIVSNPNPVGATAGGLTADYTVELNDVTFAEGSKSGVSIEKGETTVPFTTRMSNEKIPAWWVSHIENGEHTDLVVNADVHSGTVGTTFDAPKVSRSIDTDLISQFNSTETRPVNANQPFVSDPVLYINETRASWAGVNDSTTAIDMSFTVYNPKSYSVAVSELGYDITMNGVDMGEGTTEQAYVIPPKSTRTIETTTHIDNDNLDEWWVTHLERNQKTELRIDFYAKLDLQATTVRIPLDPLTYTKSIETDIFGTKNETSATTTAAEDGATATEGETTTAAEDETTTPTTAPQPTTTAADDETPTDGRSETTADDGLLGGGDSQTTTEETATPTATEESTQTATGGDTQTTTDAGLL